MTTRQPLRGSLAIRETAETAVAAKITAIKKHRDPKWSCVGGFDITIRKVHALFGEISFLGCFRE